LRLARCSGTDAKSWLNFQATYDLRVAENQAGKKIMRSVKPRAA
jgi:plasmid maintenance system antidote protein VapI